MRDEDSVELRNAVKKLKPSEQDMMHRLYLDNTPISQEEYAASIGTTYGTVRNKLTRTRHKLKALMD